MRWKKENERLYCLICAENEQERSFRRYNHLKEHYMEAHASDDVKNFECEVCHKRFGLQGNCTKHQKTCLEVTSRRLKKIEFGDGEITCEQCGKQLKNKKSYRRKL